MLKIKYKRGKNPNSHKHKPTGMLGQFHTEETKNKMSKYRIGNTWSKGKHNSPETEFKKSFTPWNKGTKGLMKSWNKGIKWDAMSREKHPMWGKKHSEATLKKMSDAKKNKPAPWKSGENCPWWKGGVSPINRKIRTSLVYKLWRTSVFERDGYACIWCGAKSGNGKAVVLNADHIKRFSDYPELRFAIDNGRTLCEPCHKTTETWGRPSLVKKLILETK